MTDLPGLTMCVVGCRRPWYYALSLTALITKVHYDGPKRYLVSDGGSLPHEIDKINEILEPHQGRIEITSNLSAMMNKCAELGGSVWMTTLDDFVPRRAFDITPDVKFLLANPDVGAIRMGRLAHWEHDGQDHLVAELRMLGGLHWWVFDKQQTRHPYINCINTFLYHRRFWDAYGDIPEVPPDVPGEAEVRAAELFNAKPEGPRIAIPMRFGQDGGEHFQEPIWQLPSWRTDAYAASGGGRRM